MKRIVISIFLILIISLPAYAHSGKTDAQGGHYNRSTGEYHFHHGYPAHLHISGVCEYSFDDQTNHKNNYSKSTSEPNQAKSIIQEEKEPMGFMVKIVVSAFLAFFLVGPMITTAVFMIGGLMYLISVKILPKKWTDKIPDRIMNCSADNIAALSSLVSFVFILIYFLKR